MPSPIRKAVFSSQRAVLFLGATFAVAFVLTAAVLISQSRTPQVSRINYSELYQIAETGSAASLIIEGDALTVQSTQRGALQATVAGDAVRQGLVEHFRKNN